MEQPVILKASTLGDRYAKQTVRLWDLSVCTLMPLSLPQSSNTIIVPSCVFTNGKRLNKMRVTESLFSVEYAVQV